MLRVLRVAQQVGKNVNLATVHHSLRFFRQMPNLFDRKHRYVLVAGHRFPRLHQDPIYLDRIRSVLGSTIELIAKTPIAAGQEIRVLTGMSDGVDQMAAEIAVEHAIALHLIAVEPTPCSDKFASKAERVALVFDQLSESPNEHWIAATDEAKLAFADVVIVVWDGHTAQGHAGSTVRLLMDALLSITPIIWIDARPEYAGRVRLLDPLKLDAPTLVRLKSADLKVKHLHLLFPENVLDLQAGVIALLTPFWNLDHISKLDSALQHDDIDPKDKVTGVGFWHSHFLSLFGTFNRRKPGPVASYRPPDQVLQVSGLPENTWLWFERFDRAATHAANRHRDQIVLIHLFSSFAVFGAIAGFINLFLLGSVFWGLFEMATLFGIGVIVWSDRHSPMGAHSAWLHFRQATEAVRMSAILHPVLGRLSALHRGVWQPAVNGALPRLVKPYHWLVVQLLRESGLPSFGHQCLDNKRDELKKALRSFVADQMAYHQKNHHRMHTIHHRFHVLTGSVFYLVVATVFLHLFALTVNALEQAQVHLPALVAHAGHWIHAQQWWLLLTAFLPALAAGLHGIMSKLGLQQVAKKSHDMEDRLKILDLVAESLQPEDELMTLRTLIEETAMAMYAEHDAWAELMQDQNLEIPA